jgi:hypothetical protein
MKNKLAQAHEELARWQSPADFIALFEKWNSEVPNKIFHGAPGGFLREAWVLAEYVKQVAVDRVKLSDTEERWPDGYVEVDGETKSVEITEVMEPWRRRGDELKNPGPAIQMDPVENWAARAEAIPGALKKIIKRKAKKRYGSPATLLVYLNIPTHGIRQKETKKIIAEIKAEHALAFEQIVVLWNYRLY